MQRFSFTTRLRPDFVISVVWLGRHMDKKWTRMMPMNDNMWHFSTGPDVVRKLLAEEEKRR